MMLFLWKISQDENNDYDTYDSAIVVATGQISASQIHPARYSDTGEAIYYFDTNDECWRRHQGGYSEDFAWAQPKDIKVVCVGKAAEFLKDGDVVCSSFNAG